MRIETVSAQAFGPFTDATLELAPGMTVVSGPNEAGKSSWHAALFAGLCGMRRGSGARKEDQAFRDRHRPWDADAWHVGVTVALEDGRRIALRHDLDGKVACSATDVLLGRDYTHEILGDGTPDGSRWLGLDRRSFLTIACVRQADLLGILEHPDRLQVYLQRAADSLGADTSVAGALDRIDAFRREHVGSDRQNAVRPLKRAREAVTHRQLALTRAQTLHDDYLQLVTTTIELERAEAAAARELTRARARHEAAHADELAARLTRAYELAARLPAGGAPSRPNDDALAEQVTTALHDWEARPAVPTLALESSADIRAQIAALEAQVGELRRQIAADAAPPTGDLEPDITVTRAAAAWEATAQALAYHDRQRPVAAPTPETGGLELRELVQLADLLEQSTPTPALAPVPALEDTRPAPEAASPRSYVPIVVAIAGIAAGLALFGIGSRLVGGAFIALFGLAGLWLLLIQRHRSGHMASDHAAPDAELARATAHLLAEEDERRRAAARLRLEEHGLPADPVALGPLVAALQNADGARRETERWMQRRNALAIEQQAAEQAVRDALAGRGVACTGPSMSVLEGYRVTCRQRRELAAADARRADLQRRLADRDAAEAAAMNATARRQQAIAQLVSAARATGILDRTPAPVEPPVWPARADWATGFLVGSSSGQPPTNSAADEGVQATLAGELRSWQHRRGEEIDALAASQTIWHELQLLLQGRSLDQLAAEARRQQQLADRGNDRGKGDAGIGPNELAAMTLEPDWPAQEKRLATAVQLAQSELAHARGQIEERRRSLPSVAEAEEALAIAQVELDRVERLDETLELTHHFLERAQEQVHRSVAPVLADTVRGWLPSVTAGHYHDLRVDPQNLAVQVLAADGHWRSAALLSYGTAEQIYLLLRVALAQHLTAPGEVCPLILDDVTVHCDRERKRAVMETLWAMSKGRQVIVFSQELDVLDWSDAHLTPPRDRVVRLAPLDPASGTGSGAGAPGGRHRP